MGLSQIIVYRYLQFMLRFMTYGFRLLCPVKKQDRFLKSFFGAEPDEESNVYETKTTKEARRKPNVQRGKQWGYQ